MEKLYSYGGTAKTGGAPAPLAPLAPTPMYLNACDVGLIIINTNMQFLAARSRWTQRSDDKYSIPLATSKHIFVRMLWSSPYTKRVN